MSDEEALEAFERTIVQPLRGLYDESQRAGDFAMFSLGYHVAKAHTPASDTKTEELLREELNEIEDHVCAILGEPVVRGTKIAGAHSLLEALEKKIAAILAPIPASDMEGEARPIDMVLYCPACGMQHIDEPQPHKNWTNPPHRSHECQHCGTIWRPADVPTNGVKRIKTMGKRDTAMLDDRYAVTP